jgi:eukaryotic-like serine/threonine-protein kinase
MTPTCPDDREFGRLLAEQMSAAEETALETHVSDCAACQARLDALTAGRLTLPPLQDGNTPGNKDTPPSAGVLERMAGFLPVQVQLLEPEIAPGSDRGPGSPRSPSSRLDGSQESAAVRRFTVLSFHAQGGLGRVHLASDKQLHRTVALKEIRPERAGDPLVRMRFLKEAEITGQLEHPGIVPIYALEHDERGRPVYAMRFIRGRTLSDAIEAHHCQPNALGLRDLLQRFISVCQTVAYAHAQGVIHRDLKPANIMLGDFGETLVVDWGLAKRLGDREDTVEVSARGEQSTAGGAVPPDQISEKALADTLLAVSSGSGNLTAVGTVMGTPDYMAPEQARGEPLSPAADIYSLGAVLFTILTGKAPYQGTSAIDLLRKVAAGEPPDVAGAPRALSAIYFKAMDREPQARYATVAELAHDVERWLADEPVGAYREPWPSRIGRWARRRRTLVTSLGVATVLVVVIGVPAAWWRARLAQERRFEQARREEEVQVEQARTGEQVEALLDRCEAACTGDDAVGARLAVGDAEQRAENLSVGQLKERLVRCRLAADLLTELDRIDDLRWDPENGKLQKISRAVSAWPGAFARLGIVVGRTPSSEAAKVLNDSPLRERLLAALDLWLVGAPKQDKAALAGLLAAADADPFRDALRAAMARSELNAVKALSQQSEALRQPAWFAAALGSINELPYERKLALLSTAVRARPRAFAVLMAAGAVYPINEPGTAPDRLAWFRAAVTVRPGSCVARDNLGIAMRDRGDLDGAIVEFRAAIGLDPSYAMSHNNLGVALTAKKDSEGAIAEYRIAIVLNSGSVQAHNNLGNALTLKGDLDGAIAEYRVSLLLEPKLAPAHSNLGFALQSRGDLEQGIAEFRAAIALDAKNGLAQYNLGNALKEKGDLDGAVTAYREAERLGLKGVGSNLAEAELWKKLLPRLDYLAADPARATKAAEAADFSKLSRQPFLKRHAMSARLYATACAADPKYANDASTFARRFDAARSAALAGCGQGLDAPADASARASLRAQGLAWLETNRLLLARRLASGARGDRQYVAGQLSACLAEKDLAGVRQDAPRHGWTPAEVAAWAAFWSEIEAMVAKTNETPKPALPSRQ